MRCVRTRVAAIGLVLLASIGCSKGGPGWINIRSSPFLATGNGVTDDQAAIQHALEEARRAGGGIVWLPTGKYRVGTHLSVPPRTTLQGVFRAPPTWRPGGGAPLPNKPPWGSILLAEEGAGVPDGTPFITLEGPNSTLEGVAVFYPHQTMTNPPIPYPWTVRAGGGDNAAIRDVLLVNPWRGLDLATGVSARHWVQGLYGQPLQTGIWVDKCFDIGRIKNVHFWNFWSQMDANVLAFQQANAVGFHFQRTDWEVVEDVFVWGYAVGARFSASSDTAQGPGGGMNGQFTNVNFDNVDVGLELLATQPYAVFVSNLNVANAGAGTRRIAIWARGGHSELTVQNASFWGTLEQAVVWDSAGAIMLTGSRFITWNGNKYAIEVVRGNAMVQGNYFQAAGTRAIHVWPSSGRVMITGNELNGNTVLLQGSQTLDFGNHP